VVIPTNGSLGRLWPPGRVNSEMKPAGMADRSISPLVERQAFRRGVRARSPRYARLLVVRVFGHEGHRPFRRSTPHPPERTRSKARRPALRAAPPVDRSCVSVEMVMDHPKSHSGALDYLLGGAAVNTGNHVCAVRRRRESLVIRVGVPLPGYDAQPAGGIPRLAAKIGRAHVRRLGSMARPRSRCPSEYYCPRADPRSRPMTMARAPRPKVRRPGRLPAERRNSAPMLRSPRGGLPNRPVPPRSASMPRRRPTGR